MNIESLEKVRALAVQRDEALKLRKAALDGGSWGCTVWNSGARFDALPIAQEHVMQAVADACSYRIFDIEQELLQLGVGMRDPEPDPATRSPENVHEWRRQAGMYQHAWMRELGAIANKRHLIDALVVTTRDIRRLAEGARAILSDVLEEIGRHIPSPMTSDDYKSGYADAVRDILGCVRVMRNRAPEPKKS